MSKLFKGLKKGLEEALAYAEGKITLKSELIEISEPDDIRRIREKITIHTEFLQGIECKR